MTTNVMACIDGSRYANAVADAATWASLRLDAPLTLLHVPNKVAASVSPDLSGSIGVGSQEQLLTHLSDIDAKQNKQSAERGQQLLEAAQAHVLKSGVLANTTQRHGELVDTIAELEPNTRLLVLGRHGANSAVDAPHLGRHVEQVTRTLHCPMLLTKDYFRAPSKVLLAFDGSDSTKQAVTLLANSRLLAGLEVHIVLVGEDSELNREQLSWASALLQETEITPYSRIVTGPVEQALTHYQEQENIDLMVMGAYGHSRIRQLILGSTTAAMIRNAKLPLLILR
ncbi:universal stress protein [Oceanisphaera pacifica]|uniref:Universal stress protein n=1 Tax=Oceanisphaera pacifica TaxID=2818389 RepID=A0ABS3NDJ6_9GAMM|nr:universal stress protein [Oceanisphaera pacifica]MBO1518662.1 universal stress protein [Oceanisphaera pacifica]